MHFCMSFILSCKCYHGISTSSETKKHMFLFHPTSSEKKKTTTDDDVFQSAKEVKDLEKKAKGFSEAMVSGE